MNKSECLRADLGVILSALVKLREQNPQEFKVAVRERRDMLSTSHEEAALWSDLTAGDPRD